MFISSDGQVVQPHTTDIYYKSDRGVGHQRQKKQRDWYLFPRVLKGL